MFFVMYLGLSNLSCILTHNNLSLIQLSDDSFENSDKTPRQPKKEMKKDTVPWWLSEDDCDAGGKYCSFFTSNCLTTRGQSRFIILNFVTCTKL